MKRKTFTFNFIIQDLGMNGGTKAYIQLGNELIKMGHKVNIIYARFIMPNIFNCKSIKQFLTQCFRLYRGLTNKLTSDLKEYRNWIKINANIVRVPYFAERYIPKADFNIATWWETAYVVDKLPSKKIYFIQHYEEWGGRKSRVDKTYSMDMIQICNSKWTADQLPNGFDFSIKYPLLFIKRKISKKYVILHAPDHEAFYSNKKWKNNSEYIYVMMFYRGQDWKGDEDAINGFLKAQKKNPLLKLIVVGNLLPRHYTFDRLEYHNPTNEQLNRLYNMADIFIYTSHKEGFGMPPMEAMACGTPVISTPVGAIPDFGKDIVQFYEVGKTDQLTKQILRLAKSKKLRKSLSEKGIKRAKQFTWKKIAKEFLRVIERR